MSRTLNPGGQIGQFNSYILNNRTGTRIYFPCMPEGISENLSASFSQQEIIGASRPRILYTSTSAKTISFNLQNLTEDYLVPGFSSLRQYVKALQALVYPIYTSGGIVKSPDLTLCLGNRTISCVCTNVGVTWGNIVRNNRIVNCNVDISLLATRDDVPGATIIMEETDE